MIMNRLVDIFNHQNFIIMKIGIRSFVQFTGKNKVYQSVALFLQKCVKTHLLASVTPTNFSGSLTLAMRQGLCPPHIFAKFTPMYEDEVASVDLISIRP
jgi:hypothetical protein